MDMVTSGGHQLASRDILGPLWEAFWSLWEGSLVKTMACFACLCFWGIILELYLLCCALLCFVLLCFACPCSALCWFALLSFASRCCMLFCFACLRCALLCSAFMSIGLLCLGEWRDKQEHQKRDTQLLLSIGSGRTTTKA